MFIKNKRLFRIVLIVSAVLFLIGIFLDEQISSALFNPESGFGKFLAGWGEFPCVTASFLSAELFVTAADKKRKSHTYFCYGCAALVGLFGLLISMEPLDHYSMVPAAASCAGQIILSLLICFLMHKRILELSRNERMRLALYIAGSLLLMIVCVFVLKHLWGRPRYRAVSVTKDLDFRPVWAPSHALQDGFPKLEHDEFRSFPSSHTSCAAAIILIAMLIGYIPSLKKYAFAADIISFIYAALVAFSRIIMGAHYLTDVAAGWLFMVLAARCMAQLFLKKAPKKKKTA